MKPGFVHLHLHTEYSLLDGECRVSALPDAVRAGGMDAVAVTDHGVLYGAVAFFRACKAAGIRPIIGCEMYVAPRTMEDKVHPIDSGAYHLVLLCKDETGYQNLCRLVSDAFTRGFYQKPRTDFEQLKKHSEGLIAMTACLSGLLSKRILQDNVSGAREAAVLLKEIFGKNLYIELHRHGLPEEKRIEPVLLSLARDLSIPIVASNDVHYIRHEDAETQALLMAISTAGTLGEGAFSLPGDQFYLKSAEEMALLFADLPEAVENTVRIAEQCRFEYQFGVYHLPVYAVPDGTNAAEYLRALAARGMEDRLRQIENPDRAVYEKRLEYELSVIHAMGFDDYYLIVWDFVAYAKKRGIPVGPGRGSAVGSLAAFALGITDVDPIRYDLLFERFLNPERVSMPDIDIDFSDERRGEVIAYVASKYGEDHVAQIITFGTMACRAAIRDVGRALGMTYAAVDEIARMVPPSYLNPTIDQVLKENKTLRERCESDETVHRLINTARKMEGRPRNSSTHATGVVITDQPVTAYLPLSRNDDTVVTQFDMNTVAELGLLKIDFLGLRFLTILHDSELSVRETQPDFVLENVSLEDADTFRLLGEGRSLGLFQLESEGMRALLQKLKPRCLEDIISVISLYRPGPAQYIDEFLKNRAHPEQITYATPLLEPILKTTCGIMLYQEQVMQVCRALAGYSYGRADLVRRAMAKKKHEAMEKERVSFVDGCTANGIDVGVAESIFDEMTRFASYAFNKSHAAAYAVVAYRTAYLKAHFPREYLCALLNSVLGDGHKMSEYIAECKALGFAVLPPDVNHSKRFFAVEGTNLRFGLAGIKNVGGNFADGVIAEREESGAFRSIEDFLYRTSFVSNAKMLESLVLSGALDSFGVARSRMFAVLEKALSALSGMKNDRVAGQISLFDTAPESGAAVSPLKLDFPPLDEYPLLQKLNFEKALTGVYFTGHPLEQYAAHAKKSNTVPIKDLYSRLQNGTMTEKTVVNLLAVVKQKRVKMTKTNRMMALLVLEDLSGEADAVVFPSAFEGHESVYEEGNVLLITVSATLEEPYNGNEGEMTLKIIVKSALPAQTNKDLSARTLYLKITPENKDFLPAALEAARRCRGRDRLCLYDTETKKLSVSREITVDGTPPLVAEMNDILGDGCAALRGEAE